MMRNAIKEDNFKGKVHRLKSDAETILSPGKHTRQRTYNLTVLHGKRIFTLMELNIIDKFQEQHVFLFFFETSSMISK
jgi:hypothetical protein